jgi:hypothetical protein
MGPFLDVDHEDIASGEIFIELHSRERQYIDHEELFKTLMKIV